MFLAAQAKQFNYKTPDDLFFPVENLSNVYVFIIASHEFPKL